MFALGDAVLPCQINSFFSFASSFTIVLTMAPDTCSTCIIRISFDMICLLYVTQHSCWNRIWIVELPLFFYDSDGTSGNLVSHFLACYSSSMIAQTSDPLCVNHAMNVLGA
jgi:hypothetical protein